MDILLKTPFLLIEALPEQKVVRIRRTSVVESPRKQQAVLRQAMSAIQRFQGLGYGLLLDLRQSPLRNDPSTEASSAEFRASLFKVFPRMAVLVRTATGKLQVSRLATEQGQVVHIFDDEPSALSYLFSPPAIR